MSTGHIDKPVGVRCQYRLNFIVGTILCQKYVAARCGETVGYSSRAVLHYDTHGFPLPIVTGIAAMSDLIYQCSKPVFVRNLKNLAAILKAAAADAKAR